MRSRNANLSDTAVVGKVFFWLFFGMKVAEAEGVPDIGDSGSMAGRREKWQIMQRLRPWACESSPVCGKTAPSPGLRTAGRMALFSSAGCAKAAEMITEEKRWREVFSPPNASESFTCGLSDTMVPRLALLSLVHGKGYTSEQKEIGAFCYAAEGAFLRAFRSGEALYLRLPTKFI